MSQRATYPAPSTPSYLLDSDSDFQTEQSAIPRQFDGSPRLGSGSHSPPQFGTRLSPTNGPEYFHGDTSGRASPSEQDAAFPPANRTYTNGSARPTSIHVPLLSSVDDNGDQLEQREMGVRTPLHRRNRSQVLAFFVQRSRLHPIMLVPAFVFGVFLAMTGIFGPSTLSRGSFLVSINEDDFERDLLTPWSPHRWDDGNL